jgi:hypothetical protein
MPSLASDTEMRFFFFSFSFFLVTSTVSSIPPLQKPARSSHWLEETCAIRIPPPRLLRLARRHIKAPYPIVIEQLVDVFIRQLAHPVLSKIVYNNKCILKSKPPPMS